MYIHICEFIDHLPFGIVLSAICEINALGRCKGYPVEVIRLLDVFLCQRPPVVCLVFELWAIQSKQIGVLMATAVLLTY